MATRQKSGTYETIEVDNKLMYKCTLCGAYRSSCRRVVDHIASFHELSPAKPVYKLYERNFEVPVPRSTAFRRKLAGPLEPLEKLQKLVNGPETQASFSVNEDEMIAPESVDEENENTKESLFLSTDKLNSNETLQAAEITMPSNNATSESSLSSNYSDTDSDSWDFTDSDSTSSESLNLSDEETNFSDQETLDRDSTDYKNLAFLSFAMKHNLAGNAIDDLICLFSSTGSNSESWLPRDYRDLLQSTIRPEVVQFHYCKFCLQLFPQNEPDEYKCKTRNCNGVRYTGHENTQLDALRKADSFFSIPNLQDQFQHILSKPGVWASIMDTKKKLIQPNEGTEILQDITNGKVYRDYSLEGVLLDPKNNNISLSFNTDGIPLFSSSGVKLWPIFFVINELPSAQRFSRGNVVLAGLWQGKFKVPFFHYLSALGEQLTQLHTIGIDLLPSEQYGAINTKICVLIGCVDLQAKAYIANMTMHNGEFGCVSCLEPGKIVKQGKGTSRCYPHHSDTENVNHPYRSTAEMKLAALTATSKKRIHGVCGASGLQNWPMFDYVFGLVPDYMHGVLLGVTKALLHKWLSSTNCKEPYFVGKQVKEISRRMNAISPPDYVERLPRDLEKHYSHFKANELQSWLIHYALPLSSRYPSRCVLGTLFFVI